MCPFGISPDRLALSPGEALSVRETNKAREYDWKKFKAEQKRQDEVNFANLANSRKTIKIGSARTKDAETELATKLAEEKRKREDEVAKEERAHERKIELEVLKSTLKPEKEEDPLKSAQKDFNKKQALKIAQNPMIEKKDNFGRATQVRGTREEVENIILNNLKTPITEPEIQEALNKTFMYGEQTAGQAFQEQGLHVNPLLQKEVDTLKSQGRNVELKIDKQGKQWLVDYDAGTQTEVTL